MTFAFRPRCLTACLALAAFVSPSYASAPDGKREAAACAACHPLTNVQANSKTPIIWGQNAGYIYVQLRDFKSRARAAPTDAYMNALTKWMSDAEMLAIANYVSTQPWPDFAPPSSPEALSRRGALVTALGDCGGCHFANWQGYSATPRLRGQTPAYLKTTIDQFRSGERANAPGMADLLVILSAEDVEGLVVYLAGAK